MTNQEINLKVAKIELAGLKTKLEDGNLYVWALETGPYLDPGWELVDNDYISDWNLLGPLMLKLGKVGWHWKYNEGTFRWFNQLKFSPATSDTNFGKATCLAYIKEFEK